MSAVCIHAHCFNLVKNKSLFNEIQGAFTYDFVVSSNSYEKNNVPGIPVELSSQIENLILGIFSI